MTEFQDPFLKSSEPVKLNKKYIDSSVRPGDIGIVDQWAVNPVSDPCVGDLETPVNSGYFTKAFINNLPFYRAGLSPNFRGLEVGAAFGYLLYGPYAPGKAPNVQPADAIVANPPADLFTREGWADFTSGFWLGGCGGAVFAWLLCGTLHLDTIMPIVKNVWAAG